MNTTLANLWLLRCESNEYDSGKSAVEHLEHLLVPKRARLSEKAKETIENIGWLECKRQKCAAHKRAPRNSNSYENYLVLC